ncbi:hypothetical protein E2C01_061153 [Portunus trituberculatus]|uniref:Uncharacterized protein n=1 Tax=Portunus trituberculatus TaxID=210409 RepID=A0A5B7H9Z4_PORTR|nr:hypothetical protein [Portunus trituberculatus]
MTRESNTRNDERNEAATRRKGRKVALLVAPDRNTADLLTGGEWNKNRLPSRSVIITTGGSNKPSLSLPASMTAGLPVRRSTPDHRPPVCLPAAPPACPPVCLSGVQGRATTEGRDTWQAKARLHQHKD